METLIKIGSILYILVPLLILAISIWVIWRKRRVALKETYILVREQKGGKDYTKFQATPGSFRIPEDWEIWAGTETQIPKPRTFIWPNKVPGLSFR